MAVISRGELETLARRYVWWQTATETMASPEVLLRQILKIGTAQDYVVARAYWGEPAFRQALTAAPPGAIDERSREFWHRQYGLPPQPPQRRSFS